MTVRVMRMVRLVRQRIKVLATAVTVAVLLSAAYIFSLPRTYESSAILLPETSSMSTSVSGNLSSLASMAGIKLGGTSGSDAIYPEFYPKVLGSTVFQAELLKEKVRVDRLGKEVTIYDYYSKYQKKPWWSGLFAFMKKDGELKKGDNDRINPLRPTKAQNTVMTAQSNGFLCAVDKKTDMISINVTAQDPEVAQQIAEKMCARLQMYITRYRTEKARKDFEYTKRITEDARNKYIQAQQKYSDFCDANLNVVLASVKQVEERLENDMQLAYNSYTQYAMQMQLAQVKVQERTPVYTTIQPATVPLKPSGPKRMFTVIAFFMLSLFGTLLYLMVKDNWDRQMLVNKSEE